jgi:hypothetical protein
VLRIHAEADQPHAGHAALVVALLQLGHGAHQRRTLRATSREEEVCDPDLAAKILTAEGRSVRADEGELGNSTQFRGLLGQLVADGLHDAGHRDGREQNPHERMAEQIPTRHETPRDSSELACRHGAPGVGGRVAVLAPTAQSPDDPDLGTRGEQNFQRRRHNTVLGVSGSSSR